MNRRKVEAVDPVAVGQGDGFEVHHLQKALSSGKPYGQVSQQPLGLLQDPIKAGEVGQGGEVGLEGGLGGQVAFGQVLALRRKMARVSSSARVAFWCFCFGGSLKPWA
jgi:hypothetical protein